MIPTLTAPTAAPPSTLPQNAQKSPLAQPEAPRSSAGETANTALRAETTRAIDAPAQTAVAARVSERDTKDRADSVFDELVGPAPTFEESLLERQARVALDPPEISAAPAEPVETAEDGAPNADTQTESTQPDTGETALTVVTEPLPFEDPPPTPAEQAEASFAETRTLASDPQPATIDVAR